MSEQPLQWFVPTWYGDIRLIRLEPRRTRVQMTRLTRSEIDAVQALKVRSLKKSRDEQAHTHLQGVTRRLDAPSVTIQNFECVYKALTKLETVMKRKGL